MSNSRVLACIAVLTVLLLSSLCFIPLKMSAAQEVTPSQWSGSFNASSSGDEGYFISGPGSFTLSGQFTFSVDSDGLVSGTGTAQGTATIVAEEGEVCTPSTFTMGGPIVIIGDANDSFANIDIDWNSSDGSYYLTGLPYTCTWPPASNGARLVQNSTIQPGSWFSTIIGMDWPLSGCSSLAASEGEYTIPLEEGFSATSVSFCTQVPNQSGQLTISLASGGFSSTTTTPVSSSNSTTSIPSSSSTTNTTRSCIFFQQPGNRLSQGDPRWASWKMGDGFADVTIRQKGCALTSAAMLLSYYSRKPVSPKDLDVWLAAHDGYDYGVYTSVPKVGLVYADINWGAVAEYSRTVLGTPLYWVGPTQGGNNPVVSSLVSSGAPVILFVGGHYVVATCTSVTNFLPTFSIADPGNRNNKDLYAAYPGGYLNAQLFSTVPPGPLSFLTIAGHSPIQLRLFDPSGRVTGVSATANATETSIPNSTYFLNYIADYNDSDVTPTVPTLQVMMPSNGTYRLEVIGTAVGNFNIDITSSDRLGDSRTVRINGSTTPSTVQAYQFNYTDAPGSQIQLATTIPTPTSSASTLFTTTSNSSVRPIQTTTANSSQAAAAQSQPPTRTPLVYTAIGYLVVLGLPLLLVVLVYSTVRGRRRRRSERQANLRAPPSSPQESVIMQERFCTNCGARASPGERFCELCGKPL